MNPQMSGELIFDKAGKNTQWDKESLQQVVLGKLDSNMQKNEPGPLSYTIHKTKLKMDETPKCETGNHKILQMISSNLFHLGCNNFLLDISPGTKSKGKNELLGLHQDKKLLHSKGSNQQN